VSILPEDETGLCTVRPSSSASEDWGQIALTTGGFQDYCKINAHTDEGLDKIAEYNKYVEEWSEVANTFVIDTPMIKKIWKAFNSYVDKRDKRVYHLEPKEGGIGDLPLSKPNCSLLFILKRLLFHSLSCSAGWTSKKLASNLIKGKVRKHPSLLHKTQLWKALSHHFILQRRQWLTGLRVSRSR